MPLQINTVKGVTAVASAVALAANPKRVKLILNPPGAGVLLVSLGGDAAAAPTFVIVAGSTPFLLDQTDVGPVLTAAVNVAGNVAGNLFSVSEVTQ